MLFVGGFCLSALFLLFVGFFLFVFAVVSRYLCVEHIASVVNMANRLSFSRCLIECRDEYKYNVEAVELLIRNHLVNMQQYDLHLAQVWKKFNLSELKDLGSAIILIISHIFAVLPVNGEWLKLHGRGICYATGKNSAGG